MEKADTGAEDFFTAIRNGNLPQVKNCLIGGVSVEACGKDGQRPLGLAAKKGHTRIVEYLLDAGADPNQISFEGKAWTALHWAAALGYEEIVRLLLKYGADPTIGSKSGKLPADLARMQDYRKIEAILNQRAMPSALDDGSLMSLLENTGSSSSLLQPLAGMTLLSPTLSPATSPLLASKHHARPAPYASPLLDRRRGSSPVIVHSPATIHNSMDSAGVRARPRRESLSVADLQRRATVHEIPMPSFSFEFTEISATGVAVADALGQMLNHPGSLQSLLSPLHSPFASPALPRVSVSHENMDCNSYPYQMYQMQDAAPDYSAYDSNDNIVGGVLRSCADCGATQTPQWRRGIDGTTFLCNSCGLKQKYQQKKQEKKAQRETEKAETECTNTDS